MAPPRTRAATGAAATRRPGERATDPSRPRRLPRLRPLDPKALAAHRIRNRLTYIAGTCRALRRRAENGALDLADLAARLERLERAAWEIDAALKALGP